MTDLFRTKVARALSMGVHESQSLLWERMVFQSKEFWQVWYDRCRCIGVGFHAMHLVMIPSIPYQPTWYLIPHHTPTLTAHSSTCYSPVHITLTYHPNNTTQHNATQHNATQHNAILSSSQSYHRSTQHHCCTNISRIPRTWPATNCINSSIE